MCIRDRWCPVSSEVDPEEYYRKGLRTVLDDHVSMLSSSGFPAQLSDSAMDPGLYDLWRRANVYAGYRYVAAADLVAGPDGVAGTATWTNFGVSSTHARWTIGYQLRDASGREVATSGSDVDLRTVDTEQAGGDEPAPATVSEPLAFSTDLAPGTYTVSAVVSWDEHKPQATRTVDFEPMNLAMPGRVDGAYPIGSVTIPAATS